MYMYKKYNFEIGEEIEVNIHNGVSILHGNYISQTDKSIKLKITYDMDDIFEHGKEM